MRLPLIPLLLAGLAWPGPLDAQSFRNPQFRIVQVGERVRIGVTDSIAQSPFASASQRLTGTVLGIAPDTLYLELSQSAGTTAIPRARIQGVSVSLGRPSRVESAEELGVNAAVMLALLLPWTGDEKRSTASRFGSAAVGAGVGLAAGALIGLVRPYERWRLAWLPE